MITSRWPLPTDGIRLLTPTFLISELSSHPLGSGPYPLAIGFYPNALNHQMNRHEHDNYLLIYCSSGKGYIDVQRKHLEITTGKLIVLPPGVKHRYYADKEDPWSIYWVHFSGPLSEDFYAHLEMDGVVEDIGFQQQLVNAFQSCFELSRSYYRLNALIHASHILQQTLSSLALLIKQRSYSTSINLQEIQVFMKENLHGHLNLDTLADKMNLSKYYFSKRFKALTGESPIQYFINLKMQYACRLLDSHQKSIKQIGDVLGYEDQYYFSRLFKKSIGISPQQYRNSKHR